MSSEREVGPHDNHKHSAHDDDDDDDDDELFLWYG